MSQKISASPRRQSAGEREPTVLACGPDESESDFIARIVATAPKPSPELIVKLAALVPVGRPTTER